MSPDSVVNKQTWGAFQRRARIPGAMEGHINAAFEGAEQQRIEVAGRCGLALYASQLQNQGGCLHAGCQSASRQMTRGRVGRRH